MNELKRFFALRGVYFGSRWFRPFSLKVVGRLGAILWFMPLKKSPHPDFQKLSAASTTLKIKTASGSVLFRSWGRENTGPHLILVHGWGGRWDQFSESISFLLKNNYRISSFDFPAHGENSGISTDLAEWFDVLLQIQAALGEEEVSYVCHSFGFVAVAYSILHLRLRSARVVAINSPTRFRFFVESFMRKTNFDVRAEPHLLRYLELRLNRIQEKANVQIEPLAQKLPVLYVVDRDDKEVPFSEHSPAAQVLKSYFVTTQGFGHNRILSAPLLFQTLHQFFREEHRT